MSDQQNQELTFNPHKWLYQLQTKKEVLEFVTMLDKVWPTRVYKLSELLHSTVSFSSYNYYDNFFIADLVPQLASSGLGNRISTEQFNFLIEHQSTLFYIKHLENAAAEHRFNNPNKVDALVFQMKELMEELAQFHPCLKPDSQKDLDNLTNAFRTFKDNL